MKSLAMAKNEQVKPLAPAGYQIRSDHEDEAIRSSKTDLMLHRRRCLQCCGCIAALFSVTVVIIIVIATVYHVRNPTIEMNSITIQRLQLLNNSTAGANVTLVADVSVKNPNSNSFKYSNTTTSVYYGGVVVGEGHIPPGLAKARRTLRMNVTVDLIPEKILIVPSFGSSDVLNMSSYTRIDGSLNILNIVKKSVVVQMNCSISYNISSQAVQEKCPRQGLPQMKAQGQISNVHKASWAAAV